MTRTPQELAAEHDQLEALVPEHALGALEPSHRPRVDAHLQKCAACRTTFDEVAAASADLEVALAPGLVIESREGSRDELLAAVRGTGQERLGMHAARSGRTRLARRARRWRPATLLAGTAVASTILVLGVLLVDSRQRADSLERRLKDARGDQVAVIRGASISDLDVAGPFGDARAQVVLKRDAGLVAFSKVPAPPEGMVWQVWTVASDGKFRSLGVLEDASPSAFLAIDDVDPDDIERIIVTVEPAGGSTEPTADEVAGGTV